MSIVQTTDFQLNEALPIDKLGAKLQRYIDKYERIILTRMLGYELYKEFAAAISGGSPDQKWVDLRDGSEYTYSGELKYFEGLKEAAVDYVYFKFEKENSQINTSSLMKRSESENAESADPSYKMEYAYNEMADINKQLYEFITTKNNEVEDTYENFIPTNIEKITHFGF